MKEPQATDTILGGQTPPPINSATLGGIEGLRQQMRVASPEQRSHLLTTALNYSEAGVNLLIDTLNNDSVLTVRASAYQCLEQVVTEPSINPKKVRQAIANGIPLKPGDRLYRVYISAMDYDDEHYTLLDSVQAYEAHDFCYDGELLHPVERYLFREQAERVAQDLHRVFLTNGNFAEFNQQYQLNLNPRNYHLRDIAGDLCSFERNSSQSVQDWCAAHGIDIDLSDLYEYIPVESSIEEENYWWDEQDSVLEELRNRKNYLLLEEFCDFIGIGRFTFVHEEIVDRDGFFAMTEQKQWWKIW